MTDIILHHYDMSPLFGKSSGPGLASRALPGHPSSFPSSCRNLI